MNNILEKRDNILKHTKVAPCYIALYNITHLEKKNKSQRTLKKIISKRVDIAL